MHKKSIFISFVFWLKISASFEEHQNHYLTRGTETAGSMSFRLKWMNKLDEDVYIVYNSILIRFNFLQCHVFKCFPYKIPAGHKIFIIFFQYPDHSQIEDGYRKEITFLLSPFSLQLLWILGLYNYLLYCLYMCCGSLVFTVICWSFAFIVVDPWSLQLLMLSSLGLYICWWSLVFTVVNVFEPLSLQLFVDIPCSLEDPIT